MFAMFLAAAAAASTAVQVVPTAGDNDPADRCDVGKPHADMPEEFAQFAFLIGDYDVDNRVWEDGAWSEPKWTARWNGRYGLDGRAVVDTWYDPGYGVRPQSGVGVNVRLWDAEAGVWKMSWHYTANYEVRELQAQVGDDGVLRMWQVYPEAAERRIRFETFEDGRWARIEQTLNADTGEWSDARMLDARPVACAEAEASDDE